MVSLTVKVKPGSFQDKITVDEESRLVISIREKPIDGAANSYLVKFLAEEFDLKKKHVVIEKGFSSQFKKITLAISSEDFGRIVSKYRNSGR